MDDRSFLTCSTDSTTAATPPALYISQSSTRCAARSGSPGCLTSIPTNRPTTQTSRSGMPTSWKDSSDPWILNGLAPLVASRAFILATSFPSGCLGMVHYNKVGRRPLHPRRPPPSARSRPLNVLDVYVFEIFVVLFFVFILVVDILVIFILVVISVGMLDFVAWEEDLWARRDLRASVLRVLVVLDRRTNDLPRERIEVQIDDLAGGVLAGC